MNRNTAKTLPASVGYIYILRSGERIKIGKTKTPEARLKMIRSSAGVHIDESHVSVLHEGYSQTEAKLHRHFAASRGIGEWFSTPFDEAVAVANNFSAAAIGSERLSELQREEEVAAERTRAFCGSVMRTPIVVNRQATDEIQSPDDFEEFLAKREFFDITAADVALMVVNSWIPKDYVIYSAEEIEQWKF